MRRSRTLFLLPEGEGAAVWRRMRGLRKQCVAFSDPIPVVFPLIRPVPLARPTFSLGEKEKGYAL